MVHLKKSLKTSAVPMRCKVKVVIQSEVAATSHHLGFCCTAGHQYTLFSLPQSTLFFWDARAWRMSPQPLAGQTPSSYPPITQQPEVHLIPPTLKTVTLSRCPWNWLPGCAHFCGSVWSTRGRSLAVWRSWLLSFLFCKTVRRTV